MERVSLIIGGFALLLLGACSSQTARTTEVHQEVKDVVKVSTADGGDVKVWTLGDGETDNAVVQATPPAASDRDAFLSRMENELRGLADRVEGLRSRAGTRAKYNSGRNHVRRSVDRLEGEMGDARRKLNTLKTDTETTFDRDRAAVETTIAKVRSDVDRTAAE